MPSAYDVPQNILVERLAIVLKTEFKDKIVPPEWSKFCKTGRHKERLPDMAPNEWWYIRAASVLKTIYKKGPIGVSELRNIYGGRKRRGMKKEHFYKGSGSIVRTIVQQLEEAGLVKKYQNKGRVVTDFGKSVVDREATKILKELVQENPELKKYLE